MPRWRFLPAGATGRQVGLDRSALVRSRFATQPRVPAGARRSRLVLRAWAGLPVRLRPDLLARTALGVRIGVTGRLAGLAAPVVLVARRPTAVVRPVVLVTRLALALVVGAAELLVVIAGPPGGALRPLLVVPTVVITRPAYVVGVAAVLRVPCRVVAEVVRTPIPFGCVTPRVALSAAGRQPPLGSARPSAVVAARCRLLVRLGHPARLGGAGGGGDRRVPGVPFVPARAGVGCRSPVPAVLASAALLTAGAAVGPLGPAVRVGAARRRPLVGPTRFAVWTAVRLVVVPAPVDAARPALPAVRLLFGRRIVGPRAAHVRAVGPGGGERGHLGAADHRGSAARWWGVLRADVAGVALTGELGVPLVGGFDHPGWFGRVLPPIRVPAAHPACLSPRPGHVPADARPRPAVTATR
ncbi:hypothetical protein D7147_15990 [Micromonospora musae]|uniref:Uncharacterized protein n=1 Tax=Micromonospora musae TaxID=1894970 RepID=A0ABX9R9A4_9ACTN|nr:hypothetical protein D7147_15990 [Micromonospora musae]